MIPLAAIHFTLALDAAGKRQFMKLKGIRTPGIRVKDGKAVKVDKAPPHVKAKQRRNKGKVTGVRPAK